MMIPKKRLVIINRSFWPDVEATGQFLTELCEHLTEQYRVCVVAGQSYYREGIPFVFWQLCQKESYKGVEVIRVRSTRLWKGNLISRLINWATFSILSFFVLLRLRADLLIVGTDPPLLGFIALIIKRLKHAPFIYHCNDLYPDVAVVLEEIDEENFLSKTFDWLNKKSLRAAESIVCLGMSMKERIQRKGINPKRIKVIPWWVDTTMIVPVSKRNNPLAQQLMLTDKFVVAYSGNIGLSQNFEDVLMAARLVIPKYPFQLIFIGDGAGKERLMHRAVSLGLNNVMFLPYQPLAALSFSLGLADVHLIPLKKNMAGAIVPSKMYGILAAGKPYLAITDKESEPAYLAQQYHCGLQVEPGNVAVLADAFLWAIEHPEELLSMGRRARELAERSFDRHVIVEEWITFLTGYFIKDSH